MFFDCQLRAPHGGIFVLPVIGNPFGFLAAVANRFCSRNGNVSSIKEKSSRIILKV